ncbi:MAG: DUF6580 family putative transport protein [Bacteroidota bacterium]|nr:DUF6580 family putative transport protein [Bacteroidota bacterium]
MINKNVFLVSLIFFAILSRFLPHPPNFTPIAAIALLSSKGFDNRWVVFLIPIVSLFISDLFIGLHATIPFVYISFILIALLGLYFKKINIVLVLLSSTIFFLVSNFGVWLLYYPISTEGLVQCYTLALPFFLNTVLGDLVYGALLIYPFYALQRRNKFAV